MRKFAFLFPFLCFTPDTAQAQPPPPPPPFAWTQYGAALDNGQLEGNAEFEGGRVNASYIVCMMARPYSTGQSGQSEWQLVAWDTITTDGQGNGSFWLAGQPPLATAGWDVYFTALTTGELTEVSPTFWVSASP